MKNLTLFKYKNKYITNFDFIRSLEKIKAYDCQILYLHSEINFGIPNPKLKKNQILDQLFTCIKKMGVQTLCIPTYTFSFCNKEIFNVKKTTSKMGILSEYIRNKSSSLRSIDPLLSVCINGKNKNLVKNISKNSIGEGSHFDKIHNSKDVKFIFFGPTVGSCFTYIHYIEKLLDAPYRYDREFGGTIINNNKKYKDKFKLFVRYNDIKTGKGSFIYEDIMFKKKISLRKNLGNGFLTSVNKEDAYNSFIELYKKKKNIFFKAKKKSFGSRSFKFGNIVTL